MEYRETIVTCRNVDDSDVVSIDWMNMPLFKMMYNNDVEF